jgi:hypothetical protein
MTESSAATLVRLLVGLVKGGVVEGPDEEPLGDNLYELSLALIEYSTASSLRGAN